MADSRRAPVDVGKYQLLMELGRGGMGIVHLALTRGPHGFVKLVVLKMLQPHLLGNSAAQRMFLEEARISARLTHPNIVQVYEVIQHGGAPTIVMEYLEGQPLAAVVREDPKLLPMPLHLMVIVKALAGLHAAHELRDYDGTPLNLIHRDVSPHNVFLMFDGQVKVLDFGIAKAAGRSEIETETGELKGKIRYMSPEQLVGDPLDRRADVFAAGVMLWEALAGRRLWHDMNDGDVMRCLLNGQVPPLPVPARVPPGLAAVCAKALASRPDDRYATAGEFQRDLEGHLGDLSETGRTEGLSAFMLEKFGQARDSTNRIVDAYVKAADETSITLGPSVGEPPPPAGRPSRVPSPPPPRPLWPWSAAVGAGLAVLLALGLAQYARSRRAARASDRRAAAAGGGAGAAPRVACAQGFKSCNGECVSVDRPDVGCGGEDCTPCSVPNATARCNLHHECDIAVCYQDHNNCDGDSKNGCETEIRIDPDNCGSCGHVCPDLPHAQRGCGDVCTIWRCDSGFRDCDGVVSDGCEVDVQHDVKNCGHCGIRCPRGERCQSGRCAP